MTSAIATYRTPTYRTFDLPWSAGAEQEQKFKRMAAGSLGFALVLGLLFAILPVPERDPAEIEIPTRLVRLIVEKPAPLPPPVTLEPPKREPVVEPDPVVEPEPVVEPKPELVVEPKSAPNVQPKPEPTIEPRRVEPEPAQRVEPEAPPVDRTQQARERASGAGVLAFAGDLAALRSPATAHSLDHADKIGIGAAAAPVSERSLVTSRMASGSSGIDTAALSRDTGGGGLAGRATTQVESPVAGIGGGGSGVTAAGAARGSGSGSGASQRGKGTRSREEIEAVFDRNKGAIHALYSRALRVNPALEGKLVLSLTIAPDGTVTSCEVVSSELGDPELEQNLVRRVLQFQFEAKDVEPFTTTKPIDFFPA